ncbi:unnamed protein product [Caenorhabditis nigoni]
MLQLWISIMSANSKLKSSFNSLGQSLDTDSLLTGGRNIRRSSKCSHATTFLVKQEEEKENLDTTGKSSPVQRPEDLVGFETEEHIQEAANQEYEEESISYLEDH